MRKFSATEIVNILQNDDPGQFQSLLKDADSCRRRYVGSNVYLRALIEFSNHCTCNCLYCGLRRENRSIRRYRLNKDEIIAIALRAHSEGYQSICLQSGEISTNKEVDFIADVLKNIKELTGKGNSQSLGITLSVGELSYRHYEQLWEAGAHRYLLRVESSNPELFKMIHPPEQSFSKRLECLEALKDIGYQVGTGVMIGIPGQTYDDLAFNMQFFTDRDIDMLGMGPYIPHPDTPLAHKYTAIKDNFSVTIKMLALARLMMPDINMVASTALQTINPDGLRLGLKAGANIVMPVLTPAANRDDYMLYAEKKYSDFAHISDEIGNSGYELCRWQWGDSPHYFRRLRK